MPGRGEDPSPAARDTAHHSLGADAAAPAHQQRALRPASLRLPQPVRPRGRVLDPAGLPVHPDVPGVSGQRPDPGPDGPLIFINACRSLGESPSYNRLDGWADKFLHAGAAAFIGSMWAVSDGAAREFAQELYRSLLHGAPLGQAVTTARHAIAGDAATHLAGLRRVRRPAGHHHHGRHMTRQGHA